MTVAARPRAARPTCVEGAATVLAERETLALSAATETRFEGRGVELDALPGDGVLALRLRSTVPLMYLQLRWSERIPEGLRYLGDTWERADGPMEWRCLAPERDLPWYFLAYDGQHTHGVGVKTGASALCRWRIDPFGVTLWLDVRNGAGAVQPGDRELSLADLVVRPGKVWELPFQAARRFAALLDNERLLPEQPLYGLRAAQHAHAAAPTVREDARFLADLAENTVNRPFFIVDHGWQQSAGTAGMQPGPKLGDPVALAHDIVEAGCRPGLWLRPLLSGTAEHDACALPRGRFAMQPIGRVLDPTHPETEETIRLDVARAVAWGFELLRYDATTLDLLGEYAPFSPSSTEPGWRFGDISLTTAEVLRNLYTLLREATRGGALLAASNALGHLAAGQVHMQSIAERAGHERRLRRTPWPFADTSTAPCTPPRSAP